MIRTTAFIVIREEDLTDKMPSHFTERYGKLNPETERMNMRSWMELINDKSMQLGLGGIVKIDVDGVLCTLVSLNLEATAGDYGYEAAFKYGVGMEYPFGSVLNFQQAEELQNKYKTND
jgi:hypothetical protein